MEFMVLLSLCVHYSLAVFVVSFLAEHFGTTVLRSQQIGLLEEQATWTEISLILTISWFVAKKVISDAKKKPIIVCHGDSCEKQFLQISLQDTIRMGLISFLYLQIYQFIVEKYFTSSGQTLFKFIFSKLSGHPAFTKFAGQLVFAVIPAIQHQHQPLCDNHNCRGSENDSKRKCD
jgi:hypothetical protein